MRAPVHSYGWWSPVVIDWDPAGERAAGAPSKERGAAHMQHEDSRPPISACEMLSVGGGRTRGAGWCGGAAALARLLTSRGSARGRRVFWAVRPQCGYPACKAGGLLRAALPLCPRAACGFLMAFKMLFNAFCFWSAYACAVSPAVSSDRFSWRLFQPVALVGRPLALVCVAAMGLVAAAGMWGLAPPAATARWPLARPAMFLHPRWVIHCTGCAAPAADVGPLPDCQARVFGPASLPPCVVAPRAACASMVWTKSNGARVRA